MFLIRLKLCRLAGIINFVLSLEKGHYLYQFGQFAWTHMILLVVFIPTSFFVSNIFDGLIWFLLPCALVIINDISAYLTGTQRACISLSFLWLCCCRACIGRGMGAAARCSQ